MNGLSLGHDGVEWILIPDHWCLVRREQRERDRQRGEGTDVRTAESMEMVIQAKGHLGCWRHQMFKELGKDPS